MDSFIEKVFLVVLKKKAPLGRLCLNPAPCRRLLPYRPQSLLSSVDGYGPVCNLYRALCVMHVSF